MLAERKKDLQLPKLLTHTLSALVKHGTTAPQAGAGMLMFDEQVSNPAMTTAAKKPWPWCDALLSTFCGEQKRRAVIANAESLGNYACARHATAGTKQQGQGQQSHTGQSNRDIKYQ